MRTFLQIALAAVAVAVCFRLTASSLDGTWDGSLGGVRAATLTVRKVNSKPEGNVVFYVVDKKFSDPDKRIVGQDERRLRNTSWDGKTLRFRVDDADFEMTLTGNRKAELLRRAGNGESALRITMLRR